MILFKPNFTDIIWEYYVFGFTEISSPVLFTEKIGRGFTEIFFIWYEISESLQKLVQENSNILWTCYAS